MEASIDCSKLSHIETNLESLKKIKDLTRHGTKMINITQVKDCYWDWMKDKDSKAGKIVRSFLKTESQWNDILGRAIVTGLDGDKKFEFGILIDSKYFKQFGFEEIPFDY